MGIGVQVCHTAAVKQKYTIKNFLMKITSAGLTSLKIDTAQLVCSIVELKELWFILGDRSKY